MKTISLHTKNTLSKCPLPLSFIERVGVRGFYWLFFVLISNFSFAQTSNELFTRANSLYKSGNYQEAIKTYRQIEAENKVSSELYYNLGNCYYKLNKVAPTIYNYEKSLQLNPNNEDAKNNLIFAKKLTLDRIETLPKTVLQQFNKSVLQKLTYNNWGIISVFFSVLASILFLLYYFSHIPSKKRLFFIGSIISILFLISTLTVAYNQYNQAKNTINAIIFAKKTIVQSEPTKDGDEVFTLHEGTKVTIIDSVDSWKKIKLSDGKMGWILSKNIKEI